MTETDRCECNARSERECEFCAHRRQWGISTELPAPEGGPDRAAMREALDKLRHAGGALATSAFNLKQRPGHVLTASDCDVLGTYQRAWDAANTALRAALAAQPAENNAMGAAGCYPPAEKTTAAPAEGDELPPLPEPAYTLTMERPERRLWDEQQVRAYARAAQHQPKGPASFPELTSKEVNDACWTFIEQMPHQLPGPIFNDLKPALYETLKSFAAATQAPAPVAGTKSYRLVHKESGELHRIIGPSDPFDLDSWEQRECRVEVEPAETEAAFLDDVYQQCCAAIKPLVDAGHLPGSVVESLQVLVAEKSAALQATAVKDGA